jgi:hypothetical protein
MKITPEDFENGAEVDVWASCPLTVAGIQPRIGQAMRGTLFMRRGPYGVYQLLLKRYPPPPLSNPDVLVFEGTLREVVDRSNQVMHQHQSDWEDDVVVP